MKRWLWPNSLRGRLIILSLVCLMVFQFVNTATFYAVQQIQREQRVSLLAQQAAEWFLLLRAQDEKSQLESIARLEELYCHASWRITLDIDDDLPVDASGLKTTGPIAKGPELFAACLRPEEGPVPTVYSGLVSHPKRAGLYFAIQLDNGKWLSITRVRTDTIRQEKLQRAIFFIEFLIFLFVMFCVLFRETKPLEKLRRDAELFGDSPETAEKLSEEGCREIRETACSLNRMRERVLGSIEERDRMLSALRHDLRTPLTRLQLWAEESEPENVRIKLQENARQIQDMVAQSLELAGSLNTTEKQVQMDIAAFVESVVDDYVEDGRPVSLTSDAPQNFTIRTRPTCLRRCLSNLIENALKYAGATEVMLRLEDNSLSIDVCDRGPGIPPDKLEKVLEPWFRVETSRNRETGGSGLGLTIAKNMASLSGAQLNLCNRREGGLVASIRFLRSPR